MRIKSARPAAREARKNQPLAPSKLTCGTTQNATERNNADARPREQRPSANAAYSQLLSPHVTSPSDIVLADFASLW